jgi:3-oxoacyl-[acyl-carrier protein] reductase
MELGLAGRVAMVAAASKGLGRASALALAAEGVRLSLCARHADELAAAAADCAKAGAGDALTVVADVTSVEDLARWHADTVARFGAVDVLMTNSGGPPAAVFVDLSDEQWRAGIDSTLMNVVRLTRLVAPGMRARRWGRIIHLTSFVAKQPSALLTISSTLRAGLSALTTTLAHQLGPDGITVNAVLPGHCRTDRQLHLAHVRMAQEGISEAQHFERVSAAIPLRRLGDPLEVGRVVAFLASEAASYVTGVSLLVDGGLDGSTF